MTTNAFPVEVSGVCPTADEYVAVNFRLWWRSAATRRNHWLLGLALALLAMGLGAQWLRPVAGPGGATAWSTPLLLAVGLAYGGLRPLLVRRGLRRSYLSSTAMQTPIHYVLTADELRGHSSLGQFAVPWARLRRAVWARPDWLLLYPTEAACYYLDLRRLPTSFPATDLAALLVHHAVAQAAA